MRWFEDLSPVTQALLGGLGTWGVTALGAAGVVLLRQLNRRLLDVMLGFAAGVMLAASFWSLLAPAIELAAAQGVPSWLPAASGLVLGGLFLRVVDALLPHLHPGYPRTEAEGVATRWHRTTLMVTAITLHNIPEGLAVGVAFGAVGAGLELNGAITLSGALALTVGIAIQNFPEGVAVAMPIRAMGVSRFRSFWFGQLSAIVEPIAAVIGAAAVVAFRPLLPYALAFAAGAMIYVVIEELIPESQRNGNEDVATVATIFGFMVMMILDVALG
ncbi:MAG: ZIP family metal transporter [Actinomycetota bacterium]